MRKVCAVALLACVLGACSGGGSSTSSSSSSGAAGSTASPSKADQGRADGAVLKLNDLPSGYTAQKGSTGSSSSSDGADPAGSKDAQACFRAATGKDADALGRVRTAKASATFANGTTGQITGAVQIFSDATPLREQIDALTKPAVQDCLAQAFKQQLAATNVQIDRLTVTSTKLDGVGDGSAGFVASGSLTAKGVATQIEVEIDLVRAGNAGVTVTLFSVQGPADHSLAEKAAKAMVARL